MENTIAVDDPEVKKDFTVNAAIIKDSPNATDQLAAYFSDWRRLKVAAAWFLKVKTMLLKLSQKRKEL